jgi:FkbM family methyltransferase
VERKINIAGREHLLDSDDGYMEAMGDVFEPHMIDLFNSLITKGDIVADIGANIGLTAIFFSTVASKTFAFEPSSSTFALLEGNLKRSNAANVEAINLGLGDRAQKQSITFARDNRSGGFVSEKIKLGGDHVTEEIQIETIDSLFPKLSAQPNFLKIDVEGYEKSVLDGGLNFIRMHKPIVVLEMNVFCLDVLQRITLPEFLDHLRTVFPHLYAVDANNAEIVDLHDAEKAYGVMYEHVVNRRFPNLVGGFDASIEKRLTALGGSSVRKVQLKGFETPKLVHPKGAITANTSSFHAQSGSTFSIEVTLSNSGEETWYAYGKYPVQVSYHWLDLAGNYVVYDGVRSALSRETLEIGGEMTCICEVTAPNKAGQFRLSITLVQEGVLWFDKPDFSTFELLIPIS